MIRPDEIIRSCRRTLSVSVDARGRVIVRAPHRYAQERIFAFLQEKERWIRRKQSERKGAGIELPSDNLQGYTFSLLGKPVKITLVEGKKIGFDGENIYLPKEKSEERLVKWLRENAKRIFTQVTEGKAAQMGVRYSSIAVTSARTRWGSCSGKDALRYTFRLLYCPKEIIEYVVVHELSHIRHKDHSKAFWQEVAGQIPDWKERRAWLKGHGIFMEIF